MGQVIRHVPGGGNAAGEDDAVNAAVCGGGQGPDGLGRGIQHSVVHHPGLLVPGGDTALHLHGIAGAQVGQQAAFAPHQLHHLPPVILAGVAKLHQLLGGNAAASLRGKQQLVVPDVVHHFPADEQPHRRTAAQVQHDQAALVKGLVQHRLRAADGHGPGVQGVAHHPPG